MKKLEQKNIFDNFFLTVCYYHATYAFQSESTLYSCLNVKELLVWNRCDIWGLSDSNRIQTQNHLVCEQTINYLAKLACLAKWLSACLPTKGVVGSNLIGVFFNSLYYVLFILNFIFFNLAFCYWHFRLYKHFLYKIEAVIFKTQMYMNVCIVNVTKHRKQHYL